MIDSAYLSLPSKMFSYDEAFLECACLYKNGYSDWRFPTISEWRQLQVNNAWYMLGLPWTTVHPYKVLGYVNENRMKPLMPVRTNND